jgi:disulfide bond formation protein DsbB
MFVIDVQADIFSQHAAYLFYLFIFAKFAVYIAYLMLDYVIHYTPCCIQRIRFACRGFLCLLGFRSQVRRPNKLSASSHAVIRNMFYYVVLQRCSFFVLFKSQNALHIMFYTIIELRPPPCKLLLFEK